MYIDYVYMYIKYDIQFPKLTLCAQNGHKNVQ